MYYEDTLLALYIVFGNVMSNFATMDFFLDFFVLKRLKRGFELQMTDLKLLPVQKRQIGYI